MLQAQCPDSSRRNDPYDTFVDRRACEGHSGGTAGVVPARS